MRLNIGILDLIGVVTNVGYLEEIEEDPYREIFGERIMRIALEIRDME